MTEPLVINKGRDSIEFQFEGNSDLSAGGSPTQIPPQMVVPEDLYGYSPPATVPRMQITPSVEASSCFASPVPALDRTQRILELQKRVESLSVQATPKLDAEGGFVDPLSPGMLMAVGEAAVISVEGTSVRPVVLKVAAPAYPGTAVSKPAGPDLSHGEVKEGETQKEPPAPLALSLSQPLSQAPIQPKGLSSSQGVSPEVFERVRLVYEHQKTPLVSPVALRQGSLSSFSLPPVVAKTSSTPSPSSAAVTDDYPLFETFKPLAPAKHPVGSMLAPKFTPSDSNLPLPDSRSSSPCSSEEGNSPTGVVSRKVAVFDAHAASTRPPPPERTVSNSNRVFLARKVSTEEQAHHSLGTQTDSLVQLRDELTYKSKKIRNEIRFLEELLPPVAIGAEETAQRHKIIRAKEKLLVLLEKNEKEKLHVGLLISRAWRRQKNDTNGSQSEFWYKASATLEF